MNIGLFSITPILWLNSRRWPQQQHGDLETILACFRKHLNILLWNAQQRKRVLLIPVLFCSRKAKYVWTLYHIASRQLLVLWIIFTRDDIRIYSFYLEAMWSATRREKPVQLYITLYLSHILAKHIEISIGQVFPMEHCRRFGSCLY